MQALKNPKRSHEKKLASDVKATPETMTTSKSVPTVYALKLTQIGNSVGFILPKEVLVRLNLAKGDSLFVTNTPGGVTLTPYDPDFEDQLEQGRAFMREYKDTFHALAK